MPEYQIQVATNKYGFHEIAQYLSAVQKLQKIFEKTVLVKNYTEFDPPNYYSAIAVASDSEENSVCGFMGLYRHKNLGILAASYVLSVNRQQGLWSQMADKLIIISKEMGLSTVIATAKSQEDVNLGSKLEKKGFKMKQKNLYKLDF